MSVLSHALGRVTHSKVKGHRAVVARSEAVDCVGKHLIAITTT